MQEEMARTAARQECSFEPKLITYWRNQKKSVYTSMTPYRPDRLWGPPNLL
jgi:hypothetical protein